MSTAREAILARIREATAAAPPSPVARDYRRRGKLEPEARLELLCERIGDYRADVRRVRGRELQGELTAVLGTHGSRRVGVPPGLREAWRPAGVELVLDEGLSASELDRLDSVVTGSTVAIAETGTIVLSGAPDEGRRALTLVPDLHVCIVQAARVVELVTEAFETLGPLVRDERRPLTFISGPSATSDIELSRVEGVHGPRTLIVLVVTEELP